MCIRDRTCTWFYELIKLAKEDWNQIAADTISAQIMNVEYISHILRALRKAKVYLRKNLIKQKLHNIDFVLMNL